MDINYYFLSYFKSIKSAFFSRGDDGLFGIAKNIYIFAFLLVSSFLSSVVAAQSQILFYDFNDNQVPVGWEWVPATSPWVDGSLQNGRIESVQTDQRSTLKYNILAPVSSLSIRFRAQIQNSFWGSANQVRFTTNDGRFVGLRQLNEEYDSSDGVNENQIRLFRSDGVSEIIYIPETFPVFEYELTGVGENITGVVTNTSSGQEYVLSFDESPIRVEDVVNIQLIASHTTGSGVTWIDDVELEIGDTVNDNEAPIAVAGDDQAVRVGDIVYLDGTGSFDDNTAVENLIFEWNFISKPEGSNAVLNNFDTESPSFTVDVLGEYNVQLVVFDELGLISAPDHLMISSDNLAPTSNGGNDQLVIVGSTVTLDGSGSSDPEMDILSYDWIFTQVPQYSNAELFGADTVAPTFVPNVDGVYIVELAVSDFVGPGAPDSVIITATNAQNFSEIKIVDAIDVISGFQVGEFTNEGNLNALTNFLMQAVQALQVGDVNEAIDKLQKSISRTDGCVITGTPDGNGFGRDWITKCSEQFIIYELLDAALTALTE